MRAECQFDHFLIPKKSIFGKNTLALHGNSIANNFLIDQKVNNLHKYVVLPNRNIHFEWLLIIAFDKLIKQMRILLLYDSVIHYSLLYSAVSEQLYSNDGFEKERTQCEKFNWIEIQFIFDLTVTAFLWSLEFLPNKFIIAVLYFLLFSLLLVHRFGACNHVLQMWIVRFVVLRPTNRTLGPGRTIFLEGLKSRPLVIGGINSCIRTHIGIALSPAVRSDCIPNNSWIWSLPSVHPWSCISVVLLNIGVPYSASVNFKGRSVHFFVWSIHLVIWPVHLVCWGWGLNIGVVVASVCVAWSCWATVHRCCSVFSFLLPRW